MEMGSGSVSASSNNDSPQVLKLGKRLYFEDQVGAGGSSGSPGANSAGTMSALTPSSSGSPASSGPAASAGPRRGKGVVQGGQQQPPRCQVEGCRADLTGAKSYYCRHKVCGMHSKAPKVVVAGMEQRFCQQCSRFHQLPEFDQGKRSCRRRLAGHNERRRKPPPGSLPSRFGQHPPTFHDDSSRGGGFLLDFSYPRVSMTPRDVWPMARVGDRGTTSHWQSGLDTQSGGVVVSMAHSYMQSSAGGTLFPSQEIPPGKGFGVSDSSCALSLLSTQPWGTAPTTNRAPTISENNYEGAPLSQADTSVSFASNTWTFKGQSSTAHGIPSELGLGQAIEMGDGQFSGELGLALQENKQCIDPGNERGYGPGDMIHWSL